MIGSGSGSRSVMWNDRNQLVQVLEVLSLLNIDRMRKIPRLLYSRKIHYTEFH